MTLRSIGIACIGLLIALILDAGAIYIFAYSKSGQGIMRDFLVAQVQKQVAENEAEMASSTPIYKTGTLPIPASYANTDYFLAINDIIGDITLINNTNLELGPVLDQLNAKTLSCSFTGFYDLMGQARSLANRNQGLALQFVMHINALASANASTKDSVTQVETQDLVAAGQTLGTSLQSYGAAVQGLLYGDTPTSDQINSFEAQVTETTGDSQAFADKLQPLLVHLLTEVQRLSASSTPAH